MAKKSQTPRDDLEKKNYKVVVTRDGPYLVSGALPLAREIIVIDGSGDPIAWGEGERYPNKQNYALCRCGHSETGPYCSGNHAKIGFDGTETADRKPYHKQAKRIRGPGLDLTDAKKLCATARFCHRAGGTWELTENSDDQKSRELAIQQACDCPSGRLVAWDKETGEPIEAHLEPSISLVEDPQAEASGPIWVKGGVSIKSSDGAQYETRNRVTLCRCGKSSNKPFCDGSHIP